MMDCRQILSASGDQRKGSNVIQVNEGTYVLKNRWTGPEDTQADYENNSGASTKSTQGGSAKCTNSEDLKLKKEVDFEPFEVPRENLDTRLRKLMSGDPESIPVFMWEYRADWIDSERKKRHQNKINLKKGTTGKTSSVKSSDEKNNFECINKQVSHVEQLFKNVKMSPDLPDNQNEPRKGHEKKNVKLSSDSSVKQNETRKGYEMENVKMSSDSSVKQNENRKGNKMKNSPLEEQLRCGFGMVPNIEDLNESFTNQLNDIPNREDNCEEMESHPTIDDVDVDYIVRQFPLEKVSGSSIKPSGLGSKLTSSSIKPKDSKPASTVIENPLKEVNVEKNLNEIIEPDVKHEKDLEIDIEGTYSQEVDESHCSTKMENNIEENKTPNELIKVEPKHHIEKVPSRKRKFIEVLGSIEDGLTKQIKLDIKEQMINAAFDKWWEEQELEYAKKGQVLKTEDGQKEFLNPENKLNTMQEIVCSKTN